jgi:hypothetical protein
VLGEVELDRIAFSHHKVSSLSKTATRSTSGTASAESAEQVRAMYSRMASLAAPWFQVDSGSVNRAPPFLLAFTPG